MSEKEATPDNDATDSLEFQPVKKKPKYLRWLWLVAIIIVIAVVVVLRSRPDSTEVVRPQQRTVALAITATGSIVGTQESALSPEYTGLLTQMLVEAGDTLDAGQVVALLSSSVPTAEVQRAQAALRTAQAQVVEAEGTARAQKATVRQVRAEVDGQIRQAQANLDRANARLQELKAGGTEQQRSEAAALVAQSRAQLKQAQREVERTAALTTSDATARAALENAIAAHDAAKARSAQANVRLSDANRELRRSENLYAKDAIARASLDAAQTATDSAREEVRHAEAAREQAAVEVSKQRQLLETTRQTELQRAETNLTVAKRGLEAALARQRIVDEPARAELIAQQQAETGAARTALASARETGRHRSAAAETQPVEERIRVARTRVDEAEKALATTLARLDQTQLKAPFSGIVTRIVARPGDAVGPTLPALHFSQMSSPEIHVDIDERDVGDVRVGQRTVAMTDTHPEENIEGTVSEIGAQADTQRGTVQIKVRITSPPAWLRSGMTADVTIMTQAASELLVVPTSAVMRTTDATQVYIIVDETVEARTVNTEKAAQQGVVITSGLSGNELIAVNPTNLSLGQRVTVNEVQMNDAGSSENLEKTSPRGESQ